MGSDYGAGALALSEQPAGRGAALPMGAPPC